MKFSYLSFHDVKTVDFWNVNNQENIIDLRTEKRNKDI